MSWELEKLNGSMSKESPEAIVADALSKADRPLLTTNFRPYEAALLHAVTRVKPDIPVLWCDSGYNTEATYRHAVQLKKNLRLNLIVQSPKHTRAYRDSYLGRPGLEDKGFDQFVEEVKLRPFREAMERMAPDVWITNLRTGQTALRDKLGVYSEHQGRLRVSPFYHWTDARLDEYLRTYDLPNEFNYYDPTKGPEHRECGIHL